MERASAAEVAVEAFMVACRTDREDAVGDLICNLMHLAEMDGDDPVGKVENSIGHYYAETHNEREAFVEIKITPRPITRRPSARAQMRDLIEELARAPSPAQHLGLVAKAQGLLEAINAAGDPAK